MKVADTVRVCRAARKETKWLNGLTGVVVGIESAGACPILVLMEEGTPAAFSEDEVEVITSDADR